MLHLVRFLLTLNYDARNHELKKMNNKIDRRVGMLINFTSTTQYTLTSGDLDILTWQQLFIVIT